MQHFESFPACTSCNMCIPVHLQSPAPPRCWWAPDQSWLRCPAPVPRPPPHPQVQRSAAGRPAPPDPSSPAVATPAPAGAIPGLHKQAGQNKGVGERVATASDCNKQVGRPVCCESSKPNVAVPHSPHCPSYPVATSYSPAACGTAHMPSATSCSMAALGARALCSEAW